MRNLIFATCLALTAASPALAKAPADIADLVGARAAGAESEMQARGYENVKNNIWLNAATGTCVKVSVSQGKYKAIAQQKASVCGQSGAMKAKDAGSASTGDASGEVPEAALNACMKRADDFQNAAVGTSMARGAQRSGANWVLKMDTGAEGKSTCTVTGSGQVVSIDPGY